MHDILFLRRHRFDALFAFLTGCRTASLAPHAPPPHDTGRSPLAERRGGAVTAGRGPGNGARRAPAPGEHPT